MPTWPPCYSMKHWFPVEMSRSRLLGALMLPYGSPQLTQYKQSICKTHTPSQNNKDSAGLRDLVKHQGSHGHLRGSGSGNQVLPEAVTVYRLWRQGLDSVQRSCFLLLIASWCSPVKSALCLYLVPVSHEAVPGQAHSPELTPVHVLLTCSWGGLLGTETPFSKENDLKSNISSYTWVASDSPEG